MRLYSSVRTYIALCLIARKWRITMSSREVKRLLDGTLATTSSRASPSDPSIHIHSILKPEIGMSALPISRWPRLSLSLCHCHFRDLNVGHPTLCRLRSIRSARQITMWRCRKNFETKKSVCMLGYKNECQVMQVRWYECAINRNNK